MYKLIVCDLDETLLNSDKKICQENIDAIKKETLVIGDNNN
ncbi:MAG: HAD hydrolase family protein, partial [Lachnospiraceae bacterium]|nr:HAD hydrolase family protein [Lachnospiraceae bacterium]